MSHFKKIILAAVVAAAGICSSAQASLIGNTITATGAGLHPTTATIGSTKEFAISATTDPWWDWNPTYRDYIVFDFGASTLTITTPIQGFSWGDWGKYVFSGFTDTITGVTSASEQNFGTSGKNDFVNDLAFTAHSITFDLDGGSSQNKNSTLVFNIATTPAGGGGNSVPEPTTVALLGLGLLGFAASRRKSAKSKRV